MEFVREPVHFGCDEDGCDKAGSPRNMHGELTLVVGPGFEDVGVRLAEHIWEKSQTGRRKPTPVHVVFPDMGFHAQGEPAVGLEKDFIAGHDCVIITSGPGTYQMKGQLEDMLSMLVGRKAARITIMCGYFPLGRSEKDQGKKWLAMIRPMMDKFLLSGGGLLKRFVSVDLHALGIVNAAPQGVITPVYMTKRLLRRAIGDALKEGCRIVLAFPDDNGLKRYEPALDIHLGPEGLDQEFPTVVVWQRRKNSRKKYQRYVNGDTDELRGATVLSFDDEAATGGSMYDTAALYRSKFGAADVRAIVTHGVFCEDAARRMGHPKSVISRWYATDTIPFHNRLELQTHVDSGLLQVVSWEEDEAMMIYYAHWGQVVRGIR